MINREIEFNQCFNKYINHFDDLENDFVINSFFCLELHSKLNTKSYEAIYNLLSKVGDDLQNDPWKAFGYQYISFILFDYLKEELCKNNELINSELLNTVIEKMSSISNSNLSVFNNIDVYVNKKLENGKDSSYIISILKSAFGIWNEKDWAGNEKYLENNLRIRDSILSGIKEFCDKCNLLEDDVLINNDISDIVISYFANNMSKYDEFMLQQIKITKIVNEKVVVYPLTHREKYSFGIVNPWPGDKSAEAEVLSRMKVGAEDVGLDYIMLDNFGHVLDEVTQKKTDQYIDPNNVEFVITTHYDTEKTVDSFYYHTLWNPPEIPLNLADYHTRITNNYLMNDDYLIYDFGGMSNHLKGILLNKPRTIEEASMLTASFPKSKMLEPKIENPKLFYCGMNWEKVVSNSNRHEGLFRLLDETGKVKFFGPDVVEAWGGLRPWEGYKCYQYSIPFDGFSILDEINACGICLVLSSDIHRRAGAATNRTYEACAAGAVIISDNNEFMQYYFKDAALFIDYNKNNPKDTFNQIMEKYTWIVEHKEEALKLAKRAQEIFIEKFAVDNQLLDIVNQHSNRFQIISKDLFAKSESGRVLVSYVINILDIDEAKELLDKVVGNIKNQYYRNIILGIVCDDNIRNEIEEYIYSMRIAYQILSLQLFDHKKARYYTDGQAIRLLQKNVKHDYYMNILAHEVWFYDHVTTLIRTMEDENACIAYSGRLHRDIEGYARCDLFRNIQLSTVYIMNCPDWLPVPGQLMMKQECDELLPDFVFDCLDGYEHYAYVCMLWIKYRQKIAFTKRMTNLWNAKDIDERCSVLKPEFQIRMIRDMVRFDLPEGGIGDSVFNNESVRQYFAGVPIRAWFKSRIYKALVRLSGNVSGPGKRFQKKYIRYNEEFYKW